MPPTSTRPRSACARTPRPTTGSARCRPGSSTSSAAGRRRRLAGASSSPRRNRSSIVSVPTERAAAGRLGVPDQARPADVVAAVGDRGRRSRARPAAGAAPARPTTACTARTPSSRRSSTGARTTTSPTGRSSRRPTGPMKVLHTIELEPTTTGTTIHFRYAAPKTKREKELMKAIGPAYGAALRVGDPESRRPAGGRARGARGGPRPRARAQGAAPGRAAVRDPAAGDDRLTRMEATR